jgi:hypothetical protein
VESDYEEFSSDMEMTWYLADENVRNIRARSHLLEARNEQRICLESWRHLTLKFEQAVRVMPFRLVQFEDDNDKY